MRECTRKVEKGKKIVESDMQEEPWRRRRSQFAGVGNFRVFRRSSNSKCEKIRNRRSVVGTLRSDVVE